MPTGSLRGKHTKTWILIGVVLIIGIAAIVLASLAYVNANKKPTDVQFLAHIQRVLKDNELTVSALNTTKLDAASATVQNDLFVRQASTFEGPMTSKQGMVTLAPLYFTVPLSKQKNSVKAGEPMYYQVGMEDNGNFHMYPHNNMGFFMTPGDNATNTKAAWHANDFAQETAPNMVKKALGTISSS